MSAANINKLQSTGYPYIIGARIKNESQGTKKKIMSLKFENGQSHSFKKDEHTKPVVHYSRARADKDRHNRQRGITRLEKQITSGHLTKSHLNSKGHNKYLKPDGEVSISIDKTKCTEDEKWDGPKGYITNTNLTDQQVTDNYGELWSRIRREKSLSHFQN